MYNIALNIKKMLDFDLYIKNYESNLNKTNLTDNFYINSYIFEKSLTSVKSNGSFYTSQSVIYNSLSKIKTNKKEISILEPSVGSGNFIPQILKIFDNVEKINFYVNDINYDVICFLKENLKTLKYNASKVNFIFQNYDFIKYDMKYYDFIIGNPPYFKILKNENTNEKNIFSTFMEKVYGFFDNLIFLLPKNFLMADSYLNMRKKYELYFPYYIVDFGINGFTDVFIEIISIHFTKETNKTYVKTIKNNQIFTHFYKYIYHEKIWLIYRNEWFDNFFKSINNDVFNVYRDRSLTNKYLTNSGSTRVLKSKNIDNTGNIISIPKYDKYINDYKGFKVSEFLNKKVFIMPNFTYNTRMAILPKETIVNGSIAILIPKNDCFDTNLKLSFFSTDMFKEYYRIIKNNSKFTINIDKSTTYYIGFPKINE